MDSHESGHSESKLSRGRTFNQMTPIDRYEVEHVQDRHWNNIQDFICSLRPDNTRKRQLTMWTLCILTFLWLVVNIPINTFILLLWPLSRGMIVSQLQLGSPVIHTRIWCTARWGPDYWLLVTGWKTSWLMLTLMVLVVAMSQRTPKTVFIQ